MTTPANAVMRRDYNHSGFVTASDAAFAEAHGMGANAWPMPPSTEPYRIWVRCEIPPDCAFRAVVTGAAELVTISGIVAQTDDDETFFPLPSGSGTCEIEIAANGVDETNALGKTVKPSCVWNIPIFSGAFFKSEARMNAGRVRGTRKDVTLRWDIARLFPSSKGSATIAM